MAAGGTAASLTTRQVLTAYLRGHTSEIERRSKVIQNLNRIEITDFQDGVQSLSQLLTTMRRHKNDEVWCRVHQVTMHKVLANYGEGVSWESILVALKMSKMLLHHVEIESVFAETLISCTDQLFEKLGVNAWIRNRGGYENMKSFGAETAVESHFKPQAFYQSANTTSELLYATAGSGGATSITPATPKITTSHGVQSGTRTRSPVQNESPKTQPQQPAASVMQTQPFSSSELMQSSSRDYLTTRDILSNYIRNSTFFLEHRTPVFQNLHRYDIRTFANNEFDLQNFTRLMITFPNSTLWCNLYKVQLHRIMFDRGQSMGWDNILVTLKVAKLLSEYQGDSVVTADKIINCTVLFFDQHNLEKWIKDHHGYENMPLYGPTGIAPEPLLSSSSGTEERADLDNSSELRAAFRQLGFHANSPPTNTGRSPVRTSPQSQPLTSTPRLPTVSRPTPTSPSAILELFASPIKPPPSTQP